MKHRILSRAVALALLAAAGSAAAITNVENNSSIPFSFSNPGARSLGMGGAFVGAADDATAAYTNPAGLTGLGLEQQVGVEFRRTSFDAPFANGGEAGLDPFDPSGIRYGDASSDSNNVSFLSWVLPRENWALALYRHETLDFDADYVAEPTVFGDFFTNPYAASTDLEMVTYGVSFAYNLNEHIALGAGLSYYDFDIDTAVTRFNAVALLEGATPQAALISQQSQRGDDTDFGYNLGLILRGSDNFNIGLAYRSAPEFDYTARNIAGPNFLAPLLGTQGVFTGQLLADQTVGFKAPDTLGVGFSWRPSDNLTLNLDVNKINYSNLGEGNVTPFLNGPDNPLTIVTQVPVTINGEVIPAGTAINDIFASPGEIAAARLVGIDDVIEPRLGMEYIFSELRFPLALRLGTWYEENHTLRFQGEVAGATNDDLLNAQLNAVVFSTGEDEMHYSAGLGIVFSSFQVDAAFDTSDRHDIFSLSGVWRF
jgi:long-chain fatty acid transport protein